MVGLGCAEYREFCRRCTRIARLIGDDGCREKYYKNKEELKAMKKPLYVISDI